MPGAHLKADSIQQQFPYPSRRVPMFADNIVASSQPLAVQAGIDAMRRGGNALDAALTTAITLTVVEPTMNGIGSDAFCILWDGAQLHGLNASGRAPADVSPNDFAGRDKMPSLGWETVTVPGAVSAWVALSDKFGRLPFADLFESAIRYANDGFMVTPVTAEAWRRAAVTYADFDDFKVFLPDGRAPACGERFAFPDQAKTLNSIAGSHGESFYRGELAEKIATQAKQHGARLKFQDLADHRCDWVTPIAGSYGAIDLHEIPPNGQGVAAQMMLGILEHTAFRQFAMDSIEALHCQLEAMKLAFADLHRHISDPRAMDIDVMDLLDREYLAQRAGRIDMRRAGNFDFGMPPKSGTVYVATADASGMMVSFIQSNYSGFGSGVVIPGTGISLHNRGSAFSLEPGHANRIDGGKRPLHTIIPAFVTRSGEPLLSFGVMGAHMQAQGQAQMITRMFDYGLNPQAASDAPRWQITTDSRIMLEAGYSNRVRRGLIDLGHDVAAFDHDQLYTMGGAQLVLKSAHGYIAGSDHRKDGMAIGF